MSSGLPFWYVPSGHVSHLLLSAADHDVPVHAVLMPLTHMEPAGHIEHLLLSVAYLVLGHCVAAPPLHVLPGGQSSH